jgi:hypothetical protein
MLAWIALGDVAIAIGGVAGGVYLACRFEWPRRVYRWVTGAKG